MKEVIFKINQTGLSICFYLVCILPSLTPAVANKNNQLSFARIKVLASATEVYYLKRRLGDKEKEK
jgi:hypothetical protein